MFRNAQQAYEQGSKATDSGREIEARALFKSARMLEDCQRTWKNPDRRHRLNEALRLNQKLWTLFQTELARPDHELPLDLRTDLLRLSAFIDRRTFQLMSQPDPAKLQALIDINRNIAMGLTATSS